MTLESNNPTAIPPTAAGQPAPVNRTAPVGATTAAADTRSIPDLLGDLRDESIALLRKEGQLARAEMSDKVERVTDNLGQLAAAGAMLFAAAVILLAGLAMAFTALLEAIGLNEEVAIWLGPIVFGLITTVIGAVLLAKALKKLSQIDPVPQRTAETLSDNAQWAQQKATS